MKRWRGQGLVEFALILPVLLLILLGIIEAALVIQGYLAVQHAAREAARFAVTYQPVQGACLNGELAPYPACPVDYAEWPAEPDEQYYARRVALIKRAARQAAIGLRINDAHLGDTTERFQQYEDEPGFFGVRVWGYPSFLTDCNNRDVRDTECLDHPGLEGLPVQVLVEHNVEILDPLYRAIVEYVPVQANAQMINEGIQVGFGDVPPPDFSTNPDLDEPPLTPVSTPDETEPTVPRPHTYYVNLNVESATNTMPGERDHRFVATVTDELSQTVQGARVSFSTDVGGFSYSGTEPRYVEELTGAQGQASATLFGNRPGMARIRAWLDYDGDNAWEAGEPFDEATKTWTAFGPYIVVSDHEVYPEVSSIYIDVMDHDPTGSPYRLLWCVISGTNTSAVVQGQLTVNAGGDATDLPFQIPADSEGVYRLETHPASGGDCGAGDLVAYSADVRAVVLPPDLSIASFTVPDLICPKTAFTMSAIITNSSPGGTDQIFDVDFYADPASAPPQSPIGAAKQWVSGIGPYGTAVVNAVMWVESESPGAHTLWARADTSNFVDEGLREDNNASVITITTGSLLGAPGNTGWRSPAANSAGANGGFTNPGGAYANNDGSRAYRDNNADGVSHLYRNYGLNVPAGAIIQGIQVRLDWWLDNTGGANSIGVDLSWDGGSSWTSVVRTAGTQRTTDGNPTDSVGGAGDTWGRRRWSSSEFSNDNFRVRLTLSTDSTQRDFRIDWVPVRVSYNLPGECEMPPECAEIGDPRPWCEPEIKPPGLLECQQLLRVGGFEGNPETVYTYWHAGGNYAYKHQSQYFAEGSMSMRLHASLGAYPECLAYRPYLWQAMTVPTDVYSITTMVVQGQRLVTGSQAPCSTANSPEADDKLYVQMQDSGGTPLGERREIANGGVVTGTWAPFVVDVTDAVDLASRQGQNVRVHFTAERDEDSRDTWFYLDALECKVCTGWPVPPPIAGTASITGEVRVLVGGIPQRLQGVDVWAYSPGGETYHTVTIQNGAYGFYNVPPGTYTIYSEIWMGNGLRFATTTVAVGADERRYGINLFLL
jgi:hypothetical protein